MKHWTRSKTILGNLAGIVVAVGAAFGLPIPGNPPAEIVLASVAGMNLVLRVVTTQPVSIGGDATMRSPALVLVIGAVIAMLATGCQTAVRTVAGVGDAAYDRAADGVDAYCELPEDRRRLARGRINTRTGAVVMIQCPGDANGAALPEGMRPQ